MRRLRRAWARLKDWYVRNEGEPPPFGGLNGMTPPRADPPPVREKYDGYRPY